MAQNISIDLGLRKVLANLQRLEKTYDKKATQKILNKAAKPVIGAARNNLSGHINTGTLSKSIGTKMFRNNDSLFVGPRIGKNKKNDGWYGNFVEYGIAGKNKYTPVRYMARAYDETKDQVKQEIINGAALTFQEFHPI